MKLIIAGTRNLNPSYAFIMSAIYMLHPHVDCGLIDEVVCGGAEGVDSEGEHWAQEQGVHITYFRPDWAKHGKSAGPKRNKQMAEYADALLLIWDGVSKGSASMRREMAALGKPIYEVILRKSL